MPTINILLALSAVALMLAVLAILTKRRLYRRFRMFFVYCIWTLIVAALRFFVRNYAMPYFLVYWITETSYFILAFLSMLSILRPIAPVPHRSPYARIALTSCLVVIGVLLWAVFLKPINRTPFGRFVSGIYVFVPLMCLLEVALFVMAVVLKRRYAIDWTRYEAGILAGFGILAFLTLIADLPTLLRLFHLRVGPQLEALFRYFPSGAFISSAMAWLIVFWRPEPPSSPEPPDPDKLRKLTRLVKERTEMLKQEGKRVRHDLAGVGSGPCDYLTL